MLKQKNVWTMVLVSLAVVLSSLNSIVKAQCPVPGEVDDLIMRLPWTNGEEYQVGSGYCAPHHDGYQVDFPMVEGVAIRAVASGLVVQVGDYDQNCPDGCGDPLLDAGIFVKLQHESSDGTFYNSAYLHLSQRIVNCGDFVQRGQLIGYSGNTGWSTGPHLHLHIRRANESVCPDPFEVENVRPVPMWGRTVGTNLNIISDFEEGKWYKAIEPKKPFSSPTVISVPGNYATIQEAINAASNGAQIVVFPGIYNEAINFLGKAIHLRSSGGPEVTIIDATGLDTTTVLCVTGENSNTILEGFTVTGGQIGLVVFESSPIVSSCVFKDNISAGAGSYGFASNPKFTNCSFVNNLGKGADNGYSSPSFLSCLFEGNHAVSSGAGMSNSASNTTVTNCIFRNNHASNGFGGAVYNVGNSEFTDCLFENNSSETRDGGAVQIAGSPVIFTRCTFLRNTSFSHGGAINSGGSLLTLTDCLFENNSSETGDGGAVYVNGSDSVFSGCSFEDNFASDGNGGAVYYNGGTNQEITSCTFTNNRSTSSNGGSLYNAGSTLTVSNSVFTQGFAGQDGGAVYHSGPLSFFADCVFENNTTEFKGGAIYIEDWGISTIEISNSFFCGNIPDHIFGSWTDLGGNTFEDMCP